VCLLKEAQLLVSVSNATSAQIISSKFQNERVDVEVEAATPSLLVISQTYYHRWRAYVDDRAAPLLRANYAFQAVQIGAGRHRVRLVYQDQAFQVGMTVSGLAVLACLAGWVLAGAKTPTTNFQAAGKLQAPSSETRTT